MSSHHEKCKICQEQEEWEKKVALNNILTRAVRKEIICMIRKEIGEKGFHEKTTNNL